MSGNSKYKNQFNMLCKAKHNKPQASKVEREPRMNLN